MAGVSQYLDPAAAGLDRVVPAFETLLGVVKSSRMRLASRPNSELRFDLGAEFLAFAGQTQSSHRTLRETTLQWRVLYRPNARARYTVLR